MEKKKEVSMRHYKNANGRVAITTSVTLFSKWGIGYKDIVERDESPAKKRKTYELRASTNANL